MSCVSRVWRMLRRSEDEAAAAIVAGKEGGGEVVAMARRPEVVFSIGLSRSRG